MAYIIVENFQYGLDTRRSQLVSKVGSLAQLTNGHINQGGEVEKSKTFQQFANPPFCFGLEWNVPLGGYRFVTFGSVVDPTDPLGLIAYQRLLHPDGTTAMAEVVHSTIFNNKTFVLAKYTDGRTFAFYDGIIINDFIAGLILEYLNTNAKIAASLAYFVNIADEGFVATQLAPANDHKVDIVGPYGTDYDLDIIKEVASTGALTIDTGYPIAPTLPIPATVAVGRFTIVDGFAGSITKVEVNGVEVTNGAVAWNSTKEKTAIDVAASINAKVSVPDYTAEAIDDKVVISSIATGATQNGYEVKVTTSGPIAIGRGSLRFLSYKDISLSSLHVNGVSILPSAVNFGSSATIPSFLVTVMAMINTGTATHGYVALADGVSSILRLTKKITSSADAEESIVALTVPAEAVIDGEEATPAVLPLVASLSQYGVVGTTERDNDITRTDPIYAIAQGGVPGYTYHWEEEVVGTGSAVYPDKPTSYGTYFQVVRPVVGVRYHGRFVCTITDREKRVARSPVIDVTVMRLKPR